MATNGNGGWRWFFAAAGLLVGLLGLFATAHWTLTAQFTSVRQELAEQIKFWRDEQALVDREQVDTLKNIQAAMHALELRVAGVQRDVEFGAHDRLKRSMFEVWKSDTRALNPGWTPAELPVATR